MEILFLGTGSAFCFQNYQSNLLIKKNNQFLLVDAGGDLRFSLKDAGICINDIHSLYISHLHNDHIGGMEFIALFTYFNPKCKPLNLYIHESFVDPLWNNALKAGLNSVQNKRLSLQDYFNIKSIDQTNLHFEWQGIHFSLIPTQHMIDGESILYTYGLMIHDRSIDYHVFLTGDTQFVPNMLQDAYNQADLVIQDCETSDIKSGVHAHYFDNIALDPRIRRKTYLWHYQDNVVNGFNNWQQRAINDGFCGFISKGATLVFTQKGAELK
ncbi:MAG: beta-lactamase domain containing protein [Candidatus Magnetoglobus multicellularis str. Araruama]|uniref:Beta-lactamase domain containing protein n=1 Tax=Candidatus Magnetoglobus multicellularis str. Araruama TaxID=890399 RepID=A0A1V1PEP2_9BACT|nr:MAG: beta-lactamase domain containing protein [Candidatus Magnetoglobus multicellularis str. Araruama]